MKARDLAAALMQHPDLEVLIEGPAHSAVMGQAAFDLESGPLPARTEAHAQVLVLCPLKRPAHWVHYRRRGM